MGNSPWACCPETGLMLMIGINNYYVNTTVLTNCMLSVLCAHTVEHTAVFAVSGW